MCIRDSDNGIFSATYKVKPLEKEFKDILGGITLGDQDKICLLYTSDAADERSSVDLGGRRIIKKKKQ
mgnify:CR=1 FL=1